MAYSKEQREEILQAIFDKVSKGEALRNVLKPKDMPDAKTFYSWIDGDEKLLQQYARATELRAEGIFEEMLTIADTPEEGIITKSTEKGVEVTTADMIQHRRLQVETRKWVLGKMSPKKYGDKLDLNANVTMEQPLFPEHGKVQEE